MPECPSCRGQKELLGIGCGPAGCKPMVLPCRVCDGAGEVTSSHHRIIVEGQRLTKLRRSCDLSLREAAKLFSVPASEWSDAEHGRIDPARFIRLLL